ncbi:MAG: DUF7144 family membrane protein [Gaiellales bacterium]
MSSMAGSSRSSGARARGIAVNGWVVAASVLLIVAGVMNIINGWTALEHKSFFTDQIVYNHLSFWGWAFLLWGVLQIAAGGLAWSGRSAGASIGVFVSGIAMVLWFFMVFSAPFAALLGFGLNLFVLCALTIGANADEF